MSLHELKSCGNERSEKYTFLFNNNVKVLGKTFFVCQIYYETKTEILKLNDYPIDRIILQRKLMKRTLLQHIKRRNYSINIYISIISCITKKNLGSLNCTKYENKTLFSELNVRCKSPNKANSKKVFRKNYLYS